VLDTNRHALFMSGEGQIIDNMMNRYSDVQQINPWLKLWGGERLSSDRKGKRPIILDGCTLSMSICCQPAALRKLATDVAGSRDLGLLSRFMFSVPESLVGRRNQRAFGISPGMEAAWKSTVDSLWLMPPGVVSLDEDAMSRLWEWAEEIERRMTGDLEQIADWAGKIQKGQVSRLAGVLHLIWGRSGRISSETMGRAVSICRYSLEHAKAALAMSETTKEDDAAEKFRDYVRRHPGISTRDLSMNYKIGSGKSGGRHMTKTEIEKMAGELCLRYVDGGWHV
jgi:hypothetical protein